MLRALVMGWTYYHLGLVDCMRDEFVVLAHAMVDLCQALMETIDNVQDNLPPTNNPKKTQENVWVND